MKVTKPFCIDADLLENLKKVNASELVNRLLTEHIEGKDDKNLSKLKQKLNENLIKKRVLLKKTRDLRIKIREIEIKEQKILSLSKKFPEKILKEIENSRSLVALHIAHRSGELKNYNWMDVKKIFYELKGGTTTI